MSKISWTNEQLQAINLENQNIIVSAGAGSGKTAVLTTRIIRKLKSGIKANQLLVLTFTNAAAAEMKNRVINKMKEDPQLISRIPEVESSYITTFDSFAYSIVRKYHYLLNKGKDIKLVDSAIIEYKEKQIIEKILDDLYANKDKDFLELIDKFTIKDDKEVVNSILKIHRKLNQKIDKVEFLQNHENIFSSESKLEEYINTYLNQIFDCQQNASIIFEQYLADNIKKQDVKDSYYALFDATNYDDIYVAIKNLKQIKFQTDDEEIKKYRNYFSEYIKNLKALCIYPSLKQIKYSLQDARKHENVITKILLILEQKSSEYKNKYDAYEFVDIAKMALTLVKNNNDVRQELKDQYCEILIDEYQDTNDLQEEFVKCIEHNNVYMVGDVKQSIYRFRDANPTIFIKKYSDYQKGINGTKIDLTNNFRSNNDVIKTINSLFSIIMSEEVGGANYKQSHIMNYGFKAYETYQSNDNIEYITYTNDSPYFKNGDIEIFYVANDIIRKIKNKKQVYDPELKKSRDCTFKDFAILLEKTKEADKIQKLLNYFDIPSFVLKDSNLAEGDVFYTIYNTLVCVTKIFKNELDNHFKKSFYGLSRSFVCKINDEVIFDLFTTNSIESSDLYQKLVLLKEDLNTLSNKDFILKIIDSFDIYEKLVSIGDITNNSVKLKQICSLAENLSSLELTIFDMCDFFKDLIENDIKIKLPALSNEGNKVKIMTVHKSKGLEFPICYFIHNFSKTNEEEKTKKFTYIENFGILTPFYDSGIGSTIKKELSKQHYDLEALSEKIRLFYVALTRCRENMVIVTPEITSIKEKISDCKTFKDLIDYVSNYFSSVKRIDINTLNLTFEYLNTKRFALKEKKLENTLNHIQLTETATIIEEKGSSKVVNRLFSKQEKEMTIIGSKNHQLFELIDFINPNYSILDSNERQIIKNFLNQDLLKDIKNAKIYKELPFIIQNNESIKKGIIDLVIEFKDRVYIIDYKLKNTTDDAYVLQLESYKDYVFSKTNKPTSCYLYSIINDTMTKII